MDRSHHQETSSGGNMGLTQSVPYEGDLQGHGTRSEHRTSLPYPGKFPQDTQSEAGDHQEYDNQPAMYPELSIITGDFSQNNTHQSVNERPTTSAETSLNADAPGETAELEKNQEPHHIPASTPTAVSGNQALKEENGTMSTNQTTPPAQYHSPQAPIPPSHVSQESKDPKASGSQEVASGRLVREKHEPNTNHWSIRAVLEDNDDEPPTPDAPGECFEDEKDQSSPEKEKSSAVLETKEVDCAQSDDFASETDSDDATQATGTFSEKPEKEKVHVLNEERIEALDSADIKEEEARRSGDLTSQTVVEERPQGPDAPSEVAEQEKDSNFRAQPEASACTGTLTLETDNGENDDDGNYMEGWPLYSLLMGICLSCFIVSIDRTVITAAIPYITQQFRSTSDIGWYGSAYLITACVFQPAFGRIYLMFSEKWTYITATALFEIGSLICGIAPNSVALILGRAIAGFGSAGILTGGFVIIASAVPLQKRPVYTALVGVMFGVGATVGPLFGGIFTDTLTWRWCFYINLPVGGLTMLLFLFLYHPKKKPEHQGRLLDKIMKLDIIGNVILLGGAVMLFIALELANTGEEWESRRIIGLLSGAGATAILFAVWIWVRKDAALIPSSVFSQRTVAASCAMAFTVYGALLMHAYFLPVWFQGVLGASALQSGVNMIPYFVVNAFFSVIAGVFVSVIGYYVPPCLIGNALATAGCGLLTLLDETTTTAQWAGFQGLVAAGFGLSIQQGFTAVQTVLPADKVSIGTAAVVASQSLGGAVFVSVGNSIFQGRLLNAAAGNKIPNVDIPAVLEAGATAFREMVPSKLLPALIHEYNEALRIVFLATIPLAAVSLFSGALFEWKSVKKGKTKTKA